MATTNYQSVEEYMAAFPAEVQARLGQVRRLVRDVVPDAAEVISYQMPTYTLNGHGLVYYSAYKKHLGMYGLSGIFEEFKERTEQYAGPKGALRFPYNQPLPEALISDLVRHHAEEIRQTPPKKEKPATHRASA